MALPELPSPARSDWQRFAVGSWQFDPKLGQLIRGAEIVRIDPRNARLLALLISRAGQVVSQKDMEEIVWSGSIVTPDSIYQSVAQLRRALGESKSNRYLQTVPRLGYRLVAPVSAVLEKSDQTLLPATTGAAAADDERAEPSVAAKSLPGRRFIRASIATTVSVLAAGVVVWLAFYQVPPPALDEALSAPGLALTVPAGPPDGLAIDKARHLPADLPAELQGPTHYRNSIERLIKVLEAQSASAGPESFSLLTGLTALATGYLRVGEPLMSEDVAKRGLRILARYKLDVSPSGIGFLTLLAQAQRDSDRYALAEDNLRRALEYSRQLNGEAHVVTVGLLNHLALLRLVEGRYAEAAAQGRAALARHEQVPNRALDFDAYLSATLTRALSKLGQHDEAISVGMHALASLDANERPDPYFVAIAHQSLAEALLHAGRHREAEPLLRQEIALLRKTPHSDAEMARAQRALAEAQQHLTRASRALTAEAFEASAS